MGLLISADFAPWNWTKSTNFNCILKQMLTSNETELKCLMETTFQKENKQREKLINRFIQAAIWLYEKFEFFFTSKYSNSFPVLSECVCEEEAAI